MSILESYIKKKANEGLTPEQIKNVLIEENFPETTVDNELRKYYSEFGYTERKSRLQLLIERMKNKSSSKNPIENILPEEPPKMPSVNNEMVEENGSKLNIFKRKKDLHPAIKIKKERNAKSIFITYFVILVVIGLGVGGFFLTSYLIDINVSNEVSDATSKTCNEASILGSITRSDGKLSIVIQNKGEKTLNGFNVHVQDTSESEISYESDDLGVRILPNESGTVELLSSSLICGNINRVIITSNECSDIRHTIQKSEISGC